MKLQPINDLLLNVANESGLAPAAILERLGYRNFNKGKRRLDAIVVYDSLHMKDKAFRDAFFEVFQVAPKRVAEAREATRRNLQVLAQALAAEKDAKTGVMPLEIIFENKGSGMHGRMYQHALAQLVPLDKTPQPEKFLGYIESQIQTHRQKPDRDRSPFGAVIGYRLVVSSTERWLFDLNGKLTEKQVFEPEVGVGLNF
jgi:hypothetical protein